MKRTILWILLSLCIISTVLGVIALYSMARTGYLSSTTPSSNFLIGLVTVMVFPGLGALVAVILKKLPWWSMLFLPIVVLLIPVYFSFAIFELDPISMPLGTIACVTLEMGIPAMIGNLVVKKLKRTNGTGSEQELQVLAGSS